MSVNEFIPQLWAGTLLKNLNRAHVAKECCNRDYEGDIKDMGDSVKITSLGRVTIRTYTKNLTLASPEELNMASQMLVIDQGQYFNFIIDDVDKAQAAGSLMSGAMDEAAWGMADTADQFIIDTLYDGVATSSPDNFLDSRALGTGAGDEDAYETLVDLGVLLTESNVPTTGRWALVPPWVYGLLQKDPRFVSFGTQGNLDRLRNGVVGEAAGFTIKQSNNIYQAAVTNSWANSVTYAIITGSKIAATYADQIAKTEAFRPPDKFGDAVKGLHVYGMKVTRPNAIAICPVTQA